MNIKRIIKAVMGLGVVTGVAYLAYKVGECSGEFNEYERQHSKCYDDFDDEDDYNDYYCNMCEPDDGCIAPKKYAEKRKAHSL